jgi:hypothetical protein
VSKDKAPEPKKTSPAFDFGNLLGSVTKSTNADDEGRALDRAFAIAHEHISGGIAPAHNKSVAAIEERTELKFNEIELIARSHFVAERMDSKKALSKYTSELMHMRVSAERKSRSENLEAMKALVQVAREEIAKREEQEIAKKRLV